MTSDTIGITTPYERAKRTLSQLGISTSFVTRRRPPSSFRVRGFGFGGSDMFGREPRLERRAASQWQSMRATAEVDKVVLMPISGFRSFDYQGKIIEQKLASGLMLDQIISVSALASFSEHHTGRPIDIGTPGCPPFTRFRRLAG